jgi:hypothetical protein
VRTGGGGEGGFWVKKGGWIEAEVGKVTLKSNGNDALSDDSL